VFALGIDIEDFTHMASALENDTLELRKIKEEK
jgi:hypothetical protein